MIKMMLIAGAGGFAGTCCRFLIVRLCAALTGTGAWPAGTLMANLIGCFLFGIIFGLLEKACLLSSAQNALLITGFCGGLTTFSTFANDTLMLTNKGQWLPAALYLLASLILGLGLLWTGRTLIYRV